ncbi:MAG: hypothetical protein P8Y45_22105, partial [Exilibacterium sp.]
MSNKHTGITGRILDEEGLPISCLSIGYVIVRHHPDLSVDDYRLPTVGHLTNQDGEFFVRLPPGEYKLEMYHDKLGLINFNFTIKKMRYSSVQLLLLVGELIIKILFAKERARNN